MPSNPFDRFTEPFRRLDTPFTLSLLVAMAACFVISLSYAGAAFLSGSFAFVAPVHMAQPWRMLTFPLFTPDFLGLIFGAIMVWSIGGSLERAWSTRGYAAFWVALSAATAVSLSVGATLASGRVGASTFLVTSALLVAWAMLQPEMPVHPAIPIKAKWVAAAVALYVFANYAKAGTTVALFALGGCAFAFWWSRFFASTAAFTDFRSGRKPNSYPTPPRKDTFFSNGGAPFKDSAAGSEKPRRPKKILTPLDDKRTWRDWGPLAAYQRYKRRRQFERLLDDE